MSISIHALLAESDKTLIILTKQLDDFYPRSPCGERLASAGRLQIVYNFYPRSPCGERQSRGVSRQTARKFLSTLSLRRATQAGGGCSRPRLISIHALLAESDDISKQRMQAQALFLSTLSLRRATTPNRRIGSSSPISIHALLAESDAWALIVSFWPFDFYPRSPCGERPVSAFSAVR